MADSVTEQAAKTEYIMTPIRTCLNQNIPTEEPCTLFPPNACVGVKNNANNHQKPKAFTLVFESEKALSVVALVS